MEWRLRVLLIGGGAREHAMALSLSRSPSLSKLFVSPGNPGCAEVAEVVALAIDDHGAVAGFCVENSIDLVVVGPEGPLVAGIADVLADCGIPCFGPSKAAAQLEGSKAFTKEFCSEFGIPTARYRKFDRLEPALEYVGSAKIPIVVKADGLAAGKGVVIAHSSADAIEAVCDCFSGRFGAAGSQIVIEEFLTGEEASAFALSDGETVCWFSDAQDHKRVGDGDTGPNTGGMGAYSPTKLITESARTAILRDIFEPTVAGMRARGTPFRGVLFAGLMIGPEGPKLIEFNVRFGDPEAQVLFARLTSDPLDLLHRCAVGRLQGKRAEFSPECAIGIVMASKGYPGEVETGVRITGVDVANRRKNVEVLQAATRWVDGELRSNGGRVLTVVGSGSNLIAARNAAYGAIADIAWPQGFFRNDIGQRGIA